KVSADPFSQLASRQQAVALHHVALSMHPPGFNGIEPGTLRRQQQWQNAHALARLLDLLVVLADPGANSLTLLPGRIIPDRGPVRLAALEQARTAPVQERSGKRAHRTGADKAQPDPVTLRFIRGPFLPQHTIPSQRFGVEISCLPGLFNEAHWMIWV